MSSTARPPLAECRLQPHERRAELASLMATALRRWLDRPPYAARSNSGPSLLDTSGCSPLSVAHGRAPTLAAEKEATDES
jgi:hypothetical protein